MQALSLTACNISVILFVFRMIQLQEKTKTYQLKIIVVRIRQGTTLLAKDRLLDQWMFCEHLWGCPTSGFEAAFLCLKTRAMSESGTNPLIRLELPTLLHKPVALLSGANSFVRYIARWSSSFAKSCAMTDSMAIDLSTGVGQHRHIKGRLAFAYGAWTVADACSPARARFCTYGFAGAPP